MRALSAAWADPSHPCTIPSGERALAKLLGIRWRFGPRWWRARRVIREYFQPDPSDPSRLVCAWLQQIFGRQSEKRENRRRAGAEGARVRDMSRRQAARRDQMELLPRGGNPSSNAGKGPGPVQALLDSPEAMLPRGVREVQKGDLSPPTPSATAAGAGGGGAAPAADTVRPDRPDDAGLQAWHDHDPDVAAAVDRRLRESLAHLAADTAPPHLERLERMARPGLIAAEWEARHGP